MKSHFTPILAAALLFSAASSLLANNIVIYKGIYTEKATWFYEDKPDTEEAFGSPPSSGSYSLTYYLALDLTTKELVRVNYSRYGTEKEMYIFDADGGIDSNPYTPRPLIETYDTTQPIKGKVPSFLWSGVSSSILKSSDDGGDVDALGDLDFGTDHGLMTGIGVPFALGNGSSIPNVAPKVSGTWLTTYSNYQTSDLAEVDELGDPVLDDNGEPVIRPANQFVQVGNATETITLDAALTKAANLSSLAATEDLGLGTTPHAPATLTNAIQRIRDVLYKQGYRFPDLGAE